MNANTELLNFIYQNSQMGVDTIRQLTEITKDEKFRRHLEYQQREYEVFHREARQRLHEKGLDEKGLTGMEKVRTYLIINFQTLMNQSTSHIAEMMMVGSNMGIIDCIRKESEYKGEADDDTVKLMDRLKQFEEKNMENLKEFLA